jgi:ATP-dependent DNA helicase PIF1
VIRRRNDEIRNHMIAEQQLLAPCSSITVGNSGLMLDESQERAVQLMQSGANVFLTGNAGTGKSTVVTTFLSNAFRPVDVTASTGVAALNLRDQFYARSGLLVPVSTVYRWAGINLGPMEGESFDECFERLQKGAPFSRMAAWRRVQSAECLVIDEISMLPGRVITYLEWHCRHLRGNSRPWGGLQVIAVGDFLQLPPVAKTGLYDWAFLSPGWEASGFANVRLDTIHRQADPVFTGLLNAVRVGRLSREHMALLRTRVALFPKKDLLRLFTHNVQVDNWNDTRLDDLGGASETFQMVRDGEDADIDFLVKNLLTPEYLTLKVGARVMVTVNITGEGRTLKAVNGSLGTVKDWGPGANGGHCVHVALDDGTDLELGPHRWDADPRAPDKGGVEQFPLRLAWAATIHKSQGLSLDAALIDARATREPGQTYVALSRVRTLGGLWLRDIFSGVWVSPEAIKFMQSL